MAMRVGVAEFLEKVAKLKKPQEKVDALKANDSFVIRTILQAAFDPRIKFLLPEGEPPYKPNDLVDQENVLIRDARKLVHFVEGGNFGLKQIKREALFIEMLETVTPADAKLLVALKDKKLPFKGITADIVKEAFPEIFPKENTN
jgi:hypothetical protein